MFKQAMQSMVMWLIFLMAIIGLGWFVCHKIVGTVRSEQAIEKKVTGNDVVASYVLLLERHIRLQEQELVTRKDYIAEIQKNILSEIEIQRLKAEVKRLEEGKQIIKWEWGHN